MSNKSIIDDKNIILRPITESDTDLIVSWRNKDSVKKNFLYRSDFTAETHQKWLKEKVGTGNVVQFIIEMQNDSVRGKGVGTQAAKMILEYGHNELGLHRIFLRLVAENIAAYKSYRKAGFITEGIFRDMRKIDGRYIDIMFMSSKYGLGYSTVVKIVRSPFCEVAA